MTHSRRQRRTAAAPVGWASAALFAVAIGLGASDRKAAGQTPQIRRWEIAATVVWIEDPGRVFSAVRLGDPVRGTLTYDVNNFLYPAWFGVVTMTIENPRTGGELNFGKDVAGIWGDIYWFDAFPDVTTNDDVEFIQSVVPPAGVPAIDPVVFASFSGPPRVLSGENPLEDLNLDDWPVALLSFLDFDDSITTYIDAEINALTPIVTPLSAADFDYDGDVDAGDLYGWTRSFGSADSHVADADLDGDADGADFLAWQRQLGIDAGLSTSRDVVPEPDALLIALLGLIAAGGLKRRGRVAPTGTNVRRTESRVNPY
jgi:hypothetical protein